MNRITFMAHTVCHTQSHSFNFFFTLFLCFLSVEHSYLLRLLLLFERVTVIKPTLLYFVQTVHSVNVISLMSHQMGIWQLNIALTIPIVV